MDRGVRVASVLALVGLTTHCGSEPERRRRTSGDSGRGGAESGTGGCAGSAGSCGGKAGASSKGGAAGSGGAGLGGSVAGSSGSAGNAGSGGKSGGAGSGGTGGRAGDGAGGVGGGAAGDADAGEGGADHEDAQILGIEKVALYQATEVTLFEAGEAVEPNAPIVADRAAELRVFVRGGVDFSPRDVVAELTFDGKRGSATKSVTAYVERDSTSASLGSTLNFAISELDLGESNALRIELREAGSGGAVLDAWPSKGTIDMAGRSTHGVLHLTLVPLVSSGFTPDLSPEVVERFQSHLEALYPIPGATVKVHTPVTLTSPVLGDDYGTGWDAALEELYDLRASEQAQPNEYYYGVLTPGRDMSEYCPVSCVVGLSVLAGASEEEYRGAIGTGFFEFDGDTYSQETLEHELGHALGRDHAPCGTTDAERAFPYRDGSIGVWGWDGTALRDPSQDSDVMSYCIPVWVSDYTFDGIFTRIAYVNGEAARTFVRAEAAPKRARTLVLEPDGSVRWGSERPTRRSFEDANERVELLDGAGNTLALAPGRLARFDHMPGGFLSVPAEELARPGVVAVRTRGTTIAVP